MLVMMIMMMPEMMMIMMMMMTMGVMDASLEKETTQQRTKVS